MSDTLPESKKGPKRGAGGDGGQIGQRKSARITEKESKVAVEPPARW
jgi:hypothetical protein